MSFVRDVALFEEQGFVPIQRPDLKPYRMEMPFDWGANPYNDSNWCFQLHTLRYLMIYLSAYRESKEDKYLVNLLSWFHDWWSWAKENEAEFLWHDMATGIRAEKIYQLAMELSENQISLPEWMREMVLEHVRVLREPGFIRINHNHGLYAIHGLRCLAELLGPGMKVNVVNLSYKNFEKIVKNQFDDNYVHKEHSPHYHYLVLDSLKRYKKTKLYDGLDMLEQYIAGAEGVAAHLCLPDGREIPFGDTDYEYPRKDQQAAEASLSVWCESGYAIVKNGLSYLCMTNSFNSGVHKHWDNLSLIYGVKGVDVLVDPGKYKYTSDSLRDLIVSSESHNTVNVNGFLWGARNLIRKSLFLKAERSLDVVAVESGMDINLNSDIVRIGRKVVYFDDELIVFDTVLGQEEYGAYSRFNFHKDFSVKYKDNNKIVFERNDFVIEVLISKGRGGDECEGSGFELESMPISYEYGSCEESISLKIFFDGFLETKFRVLP